VVASSVKNLQADPLQPFENFKIIFGPSPTFLDIAQWIGKAVEANSENKKKNFND
jgi:hypothetical protein